MNKLLSAEFTRLFRSLIFKIGLLYSAGLGALMVLMRWTDIKMNADLYAKLSGQYSNADELVFVGGIYIVFGVAVFIGIFVGTEYSDATIRNKLVVGHTRVSIYLSKLIVCAVADVVMHLVYIAVVLALGNLLLYTTLETTKILILTMIGMMAVLAFTALVLLLSMSIQSKATGAVVCLIGTLLMLMATLTIYQRLDAPEYYDAYSFTDEETGEVVEVEREKNPQYLTGGTKRKVYELLNDFIPTSQLYQVAMHVSDKAGIMAVYDGIIMIVATGAGIIIFRKKNLK